MRFMVGLVVALGLALPAHASDMLVCATAKTNPEDAAAACSRLIEGGSLSPHVLEAVLTQRSVSYLKQGNAADAASDLTKIIDLNPNNSVAWTNRGFAYTVQGRYQLAIADHNRAIELHPAFAAAYHNRGMGYHNIGRYDLALADLETALRFAPRSATWHADRGIVLSSMGKQELATDALDAAFSLDAKANRAYIGRGLVALRTANYDQAIKWFSMALRRDPKNTLSLNTRAAAYQLNGDHAKALADFQAVLKLNSTLAYSRFNTAASLLAVGLRTKALAVFKAAVELSPDLRSLIHNNLCWDLAARHLLDEALAECQKSIDLEPSSPATLDSRAFVYWLMDKKDDATRDLDAAKAMAPQLLDYQNRFAAFEVAAIQGLLWQAGFQPGLIDGFATSRTRAAIEAYQSKFGLAVTGEPDTQLLDHLRRNSGL